MQKNILILQEILENPVYELFLKETQLNHFSSYPIFLYKEHFTSKLVLGLIKDKEFFLYNKIIKIIEEKNIEEIKID